MSLRLVGWLLRQVGSFDAAHLHMARDLVPLSAGTILALRSIPFTTQTHGMVLPDDRRSARLIDRLLTLRVLRRASTRFVLTNAEESAMLSLLGDHSSTVRLPNGIPIDAADASVTRTKDVLFLARLHPRKRVLDFAHAAGTLIEEGHDATFSVVGPDDGDLDALMTLINSNPRFHGRLRYEGTWGTSMCRAAWPALQSLFFRRWTKSFR